MQLLKTKVVCGHKIESVLYDAGDDILFAKDETHIMTMPNGNQKGFKSNAAAIRYAIDNGKLNPAADDSAPDSADEPAEGNAAESNTADAGGDKKPAEPKTKPAKPKAKSKAKAK